MKLLALTFDDGPNTTTTPKVLQILKKHKVPATFFVVGDHINEDTVPVMKEALCLGCKYGNHSKTHPAMTALTKEEILFEVSYTSDKIKEVTGEEVKFFRPPYFAENQQMHQWIPMPFVLGVGCEDWEDSVTADMRVERIVSQVKDGDVILMHDMEGNDRTVEAIDRIIPILQERGYTFVTVEELYESKGAFNE